MADISLFEDDYEDSGGDGTDSELGYNYDYVADYHLPPIQKMEKYMDSDNGYHRTMVAKNLTDTLRWVAETDCEGDASAILACLARLSEDPEATVRLELMDQIPHLATYFHENPDVFGPGVNFMSNYVLPITCQYLTDDHNMIRKTSQAALLVLLEQELIDKDDFEEQVCPVMLEVTVEDNHDELKVEAIALMSKMAPLVGQDITNRLFMDRFAELCTDDGFHIRKVCASNFGDICTVIGQEKTESVLIPKFKLLCEDRVWGIRRSCAECFMAVSCCVSQEVRVRELASLFLQLLGDPSSRWVRQAAFQALGGFISTFADPNSTGLYFNDQGILVAGNQEYLLPTQLEKPNSTQSSETTKAQTDSQSLNTTPPSSQPSSDTSNDSPSDKSSDNGPQSETSSQETGSESSSESPQVVEVGETQKSEKSETVKENNNSSANCDCSAGASGNVESDKDTPSSPGQASAPETSESPEAPANNNSGADDSTVQDMEIDTEVQGASSQSEIIENEVSLEESRAQHIADSSNSGIGNAGDSGATSSGNTASNKSNSDGAASHGGDADTETAVAVNESNKVQSVSNEQQQPQVQQQQSQQPQQATTTQRSGTESFNSFQFWREPLPVIDLDKDLKKSPGKASQRDQLSAALVSHSAQSAALNTGEMSEEDSLSVHMASLTSFDEQPEYVANIGSTHVLGQHVSETTMTVVNGVVQGIHFSDIGSQNIHWETTSSEDENPEETVTFKRDPELTKQDVIPQPLLDHYLSMTSYIHIHKTDQEIARHCAYSLPAVAYTLGKKFWPCLQELYEKLASDMQWKVRRTLAFSIHELAVILGEEITNDDLVPVFNGFLKDLDEVRIGVLKHFADFLKLLKPERRREYLTKIPEFLNVDNNRNWRFREELACQLVDLAALFSAEDDQEHLLPVGMLLAEDKVAVVRKAAFRVLAAVLKRFSLEDATNKESNVVSNFVAEIIPRFAHSNRWSQRQIFAQLCEEILEQDAVSKEQFGRELLPDLLTLASDAIPNVRIAVAKVLCLHVLRSEYFTSPSNPEHERLLTTQQKLQSDKDRDVRFFIQDVYNEKSSFSSLDHMIPV